ncbi:MAG: hypothetical protein ACI90V_004517 [Bacillariaceae sp.]|jgi:hypothetical protein
MCYLCTRRLGWVVVRLICTMCSTTVIFDGTGDAVYIYTVCDARLQVRGRYGWSGVEFNLSCVG